eukprot:637938-Prorocentrum_minimum.AAC.4
MAAPRPHYWANNNSGTLLRQLPTGEPDVGAAAAGGRRGAFDHLVEKSCKLVEAIVARADITTAKKRAVSPAADDVTVVRSSRDEAVQDTTTPIFDEADFESLRGVVQLLPVGGEQLASSHRTQLSDAALQLWYDASYNCNELTSS